MLEAPDFEALLNRNPIDKRALWVNPPQGWRPPNDDIVMTCHWGHARQMREAGVRVAYGPEESRGLIGHGSGFQVAVMTHPKSRTEWLWMLKNLVGTLLPDARIHCLGHKKSGIEGSIRQLRKQGLQAHKIDSARHCQVWQLEASSVPALQLGLSEWTLEWGGEPVRVAALPGVFAEGRLDAGSQLLLQTLSEHPLPAGRVLDFGCGAGVLTVVLARDERLVVDAVDVQWQAVECTRHTLAFNGLDAAVWPSDGLSDVDARYEAIVTNPPFHEHVKQTTAVTERFLQQVARHLKPGGRLRLVANAFLPYADLLEHEVGPFEVLAETPAYRVYEARHGE
ncbi:MAG: class I SAM-dependent methyltransferase [Gammaproteobacteria bacterium]|nr:MAG: class I SAM-dependent methyltransferase [Gammaproteobacteria bacterium]